MTDEETPEEEPEEEVTLIASVLEEMFGPLEVHVRTDDEDER